MSSNPGYINMVLYDVDPLTYAPKNLLYTSDPLNLSAIDTTMGNLTYIFAPFSIQLMTDSFFIGFELHLNTGDQLGCASTKDGCYEGIQLAWEQRSDNSYHPMNESGSSDWGMDMDFWIFPIMQLPGTGISNLNVSTEPDISPNPTNGKVTIQFNDEANLSQILCVFNITGELVFKEPVFGKSVEEIDLSQLPSGIYSVVLSGNQIFRKTVVIE